MLGTGCTAITLGQNAFATAFEFFVCRNTPLGTQKPFSVDAFFGQTPGVLGLAFAHDRAGLPGGFAGLCRHMALRAVAGCSALAHKRVAAFFLVFSDVGFGLRRTGFFLGLDRLFELRVTALGSGFLANDRVFGIRLVRAHDVALGLGVLVVKPDLHRMAGAARDDLRLLVVHHMVFCNSRTRSAV